MRLLVPLLSLSMAVSAHAQTTSAPAPDNGANWAPVSDNVVGGTPVQYKKVADKNQKAKDDSEEQKSVLEQLQQMTGQGGNLPLGSEFAYPNEATSAYDQTPPSDSLEMSGVGNDGGVMVSGCATKTGRTKFIYGHPPSGSCADVKMNPEFADFFNDNFNRCIQVAAGSGPLTEPPIVWHAGVAGDAKHIAAGRSYHNKLMAIDINGIRVNGKTYTFKDSQDKSFFNTFRQCWGQAADKARGGCLSDNGRGRACGTIGEEDPKHKNHMHISFPFCPDKARALNMYTAFFKFFVLPEAAADEKPLDTGAPIVTKTHALKVKNGKVLITVRDQQGEPIGDDKFITPELQCADPKKNKRAPEMQGCSYDDVKYDAKAGLITIHYRKSILLKSGVLGCREQHRAKFEVNCGN